MLRKVSSRGTPKTNDVEPPKVLEAKETCNPHFQTARGAIVALEEMLSKISWWRLALIGICFVLMFSIRVKSNGSLIDYTKAGRLAQPILPIIDSAGIRELFACPVSGMQIVAKSKANVSIARNHENLTNEAASPLYPVFSWSI